MNQATLLVSLSLHSTFFVIDYRARLVGGKIEVYDHKTCSCDGHCRFCAEAREAGECEPQEYDLDDTEANRAMVRGQVEAYRAMSGAIVTSCTWGALSIKEAA